MRIKSNHLGLCILLALVFLWQFTTPLVRAQEVVDPETSQKQREKQEEVERKTMRLLDEVITGAWGLKLPENRSYILVSTANLLWSHDEKRARSLFWDALNNLNVPAGVEAMPKNTAANDAAKPPANRAAARTSTTNTPTREQTQEMNRYYEVFRKRSEFLRKVAVRDPQLALDMLRATRQQPPPSVPGYLFIPGDNDLEQEIASAAAIHDPQRALQIARQSLAKGLSFQLMSLLEQLNQQDQNVGSEFAADIISKLNNENLGTNLIAFMLASQLLSRSRTSTAVLSASLSLDSYKALKLDEEQKRALVEKITDAALSATSQVNIVRNVRYVMTEVEQYAPDRAAQVKTKVADLDRTLNRQQRDWNTSYDLYQTATPEEMIKAAEKMTGEERDGVYRNAIIKATMNGRADALREFIDQQVEDDSRKRTLLDLLDSEQLDTAVNQGKADEVQKLLPLIRHKEQRALAMSELAILLEKKGDHDSAVKLLDEARGLVKVDLRSQTQSNALLALMLAYALVEPDKAFQIIEPIVDRANEEISKMMLLDRIVKSGATRNGEILLPPPNVSMEFGLFKYAPGIVALANADFTRTKSLADRFERNELRLLARLLLVQALWRKHESAAIAN